MSPLQLLYRLNEENLGTRRRKSLNSSAIAAERKGTSLRNARTLHLERKLMVWFNDYHTEPDYKDWVIDTAATSHVCHDISLFETFPV